MKSILFVMIFSLALPLMAQQPQSCVKTAREISTILEKSALLKIQKQTVLNSLDSTDAQKKKIDAIDEEIVATRLPLDDLIALSREQTHTQYDGLVREKFQIWMRDVETSYAAATVLKNNNVANYPASLREFNDSIDTSARLLEKFSEQLVNLTCNIY